MWTLTTILVDDNDFHWGVSVEYKCDTQDESMQHVCLIV